jgi:hypothetical protein
MPIAAATVVLAAPAHAAGSDEQRSACMGDAFKFCSGDIPDETAIEGCLRRNARRLSSACQLVMGGSPPGEATTRRASRSIAAPQQEASVDAPLAAVASAAGEPSYVDDERPSRRRQYRHHRRHVAYAHHRRHHGAGFGGDLASMAGPAMAVMPMLTSLFQDGGPSLDDDD